MSHKPLEALQVIAIRYINDQLSQPTEDGLAQVKVSGVFENAGVPFEYCEPSFPEERRTPHEEENLGLLGGKIADMVSQAQRAGKAVVVVGGNCAHMTGVVGGLQQVHGAAARIGLVWFDAHGDFNTPQTSLTGRLFGMPVAVSAGLACPQWREASGILTPLPTERILLVDARNLDRAEAQLIRAVGTPIASVAPGFPGEDLQAALDRLAGRCDLIYLHIDSDVLDEDYTPNHVTPEPEGPDVEQVCTAIEKVFATGKVAAYAVVCIFGDGKDNNVLINACIEMLQRGLAAWKK